MQGWECVWTHPELGLTLSVYVDDFKLAGPVQNIDRGWDLIRKGGIKLDPPTKLDNYLRCSQAPCDVTDDEFEKRMASIRTALAKQCAN